MHQAQLRVHFAVLESEVRLSDRRIVPLDVAARLLGTPDEVHWVYSESPGDTHYRERVIRFSNEHVVEVITGWYLD